VRSRPSPRAGLQEPFPWGITAPGFSQGRVSRPPPEGFKRRFLGGSLPLALARGTFSTRRSSEAFRLAHALGGVSPVLGGVSPVLGGVSPVLGGVSPVLGGVTLVLGGVSSVLGGVSLAMCNRKDGYEF
jgi:hypothetical protein